MFGASGQSLSIAITSPTGKTSYCEGEQITFTATILHTLNNPCNSQGSTGGTFLSYQWYINGNSAPSNNNTFITNSLKLNDKVHCVLSFNYACGGPPQNPTIITVPYTSQNIFINIKDGISLSLGGNPYPITGKIKEVYGYGSLPNLGYEQIITGYDIEYELSNPLLKTPSSGTYVSLGFPVKLYSIDISNTAASSNLFIKTRPKGCLNSPWVVSQALNITSINTPPTAPNLVSARQIRTSKNVKIVWKTSTDNIRAAKYTIFFKKDSIGAPLRNIQYVPTTATTPNTSYEIPAAAFGVDGNGAYTIYVTATDNDSAATVGAGLANLFIYDTTPPLAPSKPEILARTTTKTILTWTDGGDNVATTEYLIFVNGVKKDTIPALSLPYTLTNPTPMPDSIQITIKARDAKFNTSAFSQKVVVKKLPAINIDEATGFVGIGVVPPTDRLHVSGNLKIEDGTLIFKGTPPMGTHIKAEVGDVKIGSNIVLDSLGVDKANRITFKGSALDFYTPTQAQWNGNKPVLSLTKLGEIEFFSSPTLNYNTIMLKGKGDYNSGLRFGSNDGGATGFAGPMLYGENGGALGSNTANDNSKITNVALKWDATGKVGIGVAGTLTDRLHVGGNVRFDGGIILKNAFNPNATYYANDNFISFGHPGVSEDFIGYRNNTFFMMDSDGGGDTSHPSLVVGGSISSNSNLQIDGNANVNGTLYVSGNNLVLGDNGSGESIVRNVPELSISFKTGFSEKMKLANNGNLLIGTNAPTNCKLGVDGNIRAKGIVAAYELVANATATPDFVFENSYSLPSLQSTKDFVKQHKHLPYIKSAKELEATGINMTEHTNGMLRHIEEMYLHIIKLEEEIKALKK